MQKPKLIERVVEALKKHGSLTLEQIAKHAGTTMGTLYTMQPQFKARGVVKSQASPTAPASYSISKPKGDALERGAELGRKDPDKSGRISLKKGHGRKATRRRTSRNGAGAAAAAPAPAPHINGNGAHFAINEHGELGIDKGETKVKLDADEFTRLRGFIERTQPVWKGARA